MRIIVPRSSLPASSTTPTSGAVEALGGDLFGELIFLLTGLGVERGLRGHRAAHERGANREYESNAKS
jgi:hypothetical protein